MLCREHCAKNYTSKCIRKQKERTARRERTRGMLAFLSQNLSSETEMGIQSPKLYLVSIISVFQSHSEYLFTT
jgi:hypothetical protein